MTETKGMKMNKTVTNKKQMNSTQNITVNNDE